MSESEIKKLVKKGKPALVMMCAKLGIKATLDNTAKDMATWIIDEVDDLNTWLEAKAGVPADMKKMQEDVKTGIYKGKCVKTGKKLYSK